MELKELDDWEWRCIICEKINDEETNVCVCGHKRSFYG